jgi:hypothetical protein
MLDSNCRIVERPGSTESCVLLRTGEDKEVSMTDVKSTFNALAFLVEAGVGRSGAQDCLSCSGGSVV